MLKSIVRHGLWFVTVGRLFARRAKSRRLRDKVFFIFEGREFTYHQTWVEATRYAGWFEQLRAQRVEAGDLAADAPLLVGIYQENSPEFVFAFFGAALTGAVIFGLNTGFRGPTLATMINQAGLHVVLTDANYQPELERIQDTLESLAPDDIVRTDTGEPIGQQTTPRQAARSSDPLIVIYTSGTTGAPKGVMCPHIKLIGAALMTWRRIGLRRSDRGYVCMPMFHSNAWFLGIMPMLFVGGSFVMTRRFSARGFETDLLAHQITYMNYVGQPIHYILAALEKHYGDGDAVTAALAADPRNAFRIAHGNGATPTDRTKLVRYLGMEHIFELYGSTEAAINTVVKPGDPIDSVGAMKANTLILNEAGAQCPPAEYDEQGRVTNYDQAVGEIVAKIGRNNVFFDGYHNNAKATDGKFRDGYFRSGDLGHVRIVNGKRYLYFDGRTDDWIRKDGENFSAENVAHFAGEHPDVAIAVAYGAPHPVADEAVMIAVQLTEGAAFDPQATFDRFAAQRDTGGLDPKWFPDYIRVVEQFETTRTQKVLIRPLKRGHFVSQAPGEQLFYRARGDETYHPLTAEALASIRQEFDSNGRGQLLTR